MGRVIQEFKAEPIDEICKFYEKDVENCIEGLEREPEREVMVRCFLPQKKKEQEDGNYRVSYEFSEIIYVQAKVPECIQLILAILTTDGELKIMIQKSVKTNIDSVTWEQSCQFLKFYDQRDLSFFTNGDKCVCRFCYYPNSNCYSFKQWLKDKKFLTFPDDNDD